MKNFKKLSTLELESVTGGSAKSIYSIVTGGISIISEAWKTAKKDYKRWG
ncbi:hypothetical protein ACQXW1_02285 [Lactiplantibacillus pentosus]|jgi:bacteriocin-like protein|nr:hypothetical protein [Lactiplantibacillus pentosus]MCH4129471.1 hypothetical protein [Lactiplantibacillus sp.]UXI97729.1 hypothetical protein N5A89_01825 [Lactiplantibacillus pentosus]